MLDRLYQERRPIESLGELYRHPATFPHSEWVQVAKIEPTNDDGIGSVLHECRVPARFFRLITDPGSDGTPSLEIGSGSGGACGELLGRLALEMAAGMVAIRIHRPD